MSEDGAKRDGSGRDAGEASLAARLRMAADGELDESQREALESHLARSLEDRARVQFEQELRGAVGRVMGGARAPESLRARVTEIVAASREGGKAPAPVTEAPRMDETSGPERLAPRTRRASFWTRRQTMGALAAAAVLLVASVFIWQAATIARVRLNPDQEQYRAELVHHVAEQHRGVMDARAASAKLVMHEPEEVERFFAEVIEAPSDEVRRLIESTADCIFRGAGNCHLPRAPGAAAHIKLGVEVDGRTAPVSVFVSADPGALPLEPGVTYVVDTKACDEPGSRVLAWTDGRLLYVVVSETVLDACPSILSRLGRPMPSKRL